ncbi:hypothetical protein ACJJIL_15110 [Microbulbifer sp. EKSA005]|uniref:hypothetical protein n=1 Tax=Microbulbifer sp. EKSA005 TaxID=3243364 RepID=UPI004041E608
MKTESLLNISIAIMALAISYMAYSYTIESRTSDNKTRWNLYLHEYQLDLLNQVNLLNCYQYFHDGKDRHPASETLMIDVKKRFDDSKWDESTGANEFQERIISFSSYHRENKMRIYSHLVELRAPMKPAVRQNADNICKGSFASL